ncbi:uncharacterized protein LOC119607689 [Lucilia sericata]|uniref:uncharacterized protein LOC119607689 n=1 Tax=Lucilia sericata TaxID=13632 RepID=UPI0018A82874|nr:uncharacterized protein LOC119607689 [Lucilia sericata]
MFSSLLRFKQTKSFVEFYQHFKINQTIEPVRPAAALIGRKMATRVDAEFANFEAKISLNNPVTDYVKLMDDKMKADVIMPNDVYDECWKKISAATRETVWKLLFEAGESCAQKEQLEKAAELLKMHKEDACFYQASDYNNWIVRVRDELLKRKMLEFWKNVVVQKELGPCWARDSDLFDDVEDPEPANFYKFADCEAPWLKNKSQSTVPNVSDLLATSLLHKESPKTDKTLKKLSIETPVEDYKHNVEAQGEIDGDDEEAYKQIFAEARQMIWQLLFDEGSLTAENSKKAAELLELYKSDACFYCPWDYNDWIPTVRDELLKRKYFDFWQDVIVKKELGLCWARDSDYFDDMEDKRPIEFYKVGEDFIKQQKK